MKKRSKKFLNALSKVDLEKNYSIDEALKLSKEVSFANFDETVDVVY